MSIGGRFRGFRRFRRFSRFSRFSRFRGFRIVDPVAALRAEVL